MAKNSTVLSNPNTDRIYKTLLDVSEAISKCRDLHDLFRHLAKLLPPIVGVDFIGFSLYDPQRNVLKDFLIQANVPADILGGMEASLDSHPCGTVFQTQEPILVADILQDKRYPEAFSRMHEDGVNSICMFPLTTAVRKIGAIGFANCKKEAYRESDVEILHQISKQVAVAVDNVLHFQELRKERDHSRLLMEVNNAVVSHLDLQDVFTAVSACLRKVLQHDGSILVLYDRDMQRYRIHILDFEKKDHFVEEGQLTPELKCPSEKTIKTRKPVIYRKHDLETFAIESKIAQGMLDQGVRSLCSVPLMSHDRILGTLDVTRSRENDFTPSDGQLLNEVGQQIAIALENGLAYQEIAALKEKLKKEKLYLEDEIRGDHNFEEILGESSTLKGVLNQVGIVAPTDSTVLIQGETGTGKELIARAIHNMSTRRDRTFVKLNCAAIPTGLLESELFGHEKGAFTGAIGAKIGRFELADLGTLFLDEIGEIPLEFQVKLLRVLQEQEFERLGSTRTVHVNVRVVVATNRDLAQLVAEKEFRDDLYYRLNVFPVSVPPLRERVKDIPLLVRHFTQKFAQQMRKPIETIPSEAIIALQQYPWPGNVRELKNFIERAVILTQGSDLYVPLTELTRAPNGSSGSPATLEQTERNHILQVLRETKWVISGASGAAAKLGIKRTTLTSKMKKLRISRPV